MSRFMLWVFEHDAEQIAQAGSCAPAGGALGEIDAVPEGQAEGLHAGIPQAAGCDSPGEGEGRAAPQGHRGTAQGTGLQANRETQE